MYTTLRSSHLSRSHACRGTITIDKAYQSKFNEVGFDLPLAYSSWLPGRQGKRTFPEPHSCLRPKFCSSCQTPSAGRAVAPSTTSPEETASVAAGFQAIGIEAEVSRAIGGVTQ